MVRWLQGTPVVSSWQRLRCQPCHQCHAPGTRDREELLDSSVSAIATMNNLPTNPTTILLPNVLKLSPARPEKA